MAATAEAAVEAQRMLAEEKAALQVQLEASNGTCSTLEAKARPLSAHQYLRVILRDEICSQHLGKVGVDGARLLIIILCNVCGLLQVAALSADAAAQELRLGELAAQLAASEARSAELQANAAQAAAQARQVQDNLQTQLVELQGACAALTKDAEGCLAYQQELEGAGSQFSALLCLWTQKSDKP